MRSESASPARALARAPSLSNRSPLCLCRWRLREMRRLTRETDAEAAAAREAAETARRRSLAPEAREKEDRELEAQGVKVFAKTKEK